MKKIIMASILCAWAGTSMAQSTEDWEISAQVNLWGAGLSGTTATGREIDLGFSDVLDKLDFAFMGTVVAKRDRLFTFADIIRMKVSEDKNAAVGPEIPVVADARVKGTILTAGIGYDLAKTDGSLLAPFAGARALWLNSKVNLAVGPGSGRVTSKDTYLDAIVGVAGSAELSKDWALSYYADVGAGESDLTWQAMLTVDRQFDAWTLSVGYRHMTYDLPSESNLRDVSFSGPIIGAKVRF